jgi:multiple sugar transport system substrate-binding protein
MKPVVRKIVVSLLAATLLSLAVAQYEGVSVDIVTFTGPQIAEPLQRRAPEFGELTGATINVITVPFSDLYQQVLTDFATGTNSFDGAVFAPQWMVDYIVPGYLEDLTASVEADGAIEWADIGPFFRDFSSTYEGSIYTIPLDGDFLMVYYRTDVLDDIGMDPPQTWDDYLAIAEAADGMDMNGDGEADYGSCIGKARNNQAYWFTTSIAAPMLQYEGTSQGVFFDLDTFEPLIDNPAFARAVEIYKATTDFGPPDELNLGVGDTRGLWTAGRCALTLDWGDIGTLAIAEGSAVADTTGATINPGSTMVLNRETGELDTCTDELCPFHQGGINYAPFAAFGGWSGGINASADPEVKEALYAFFSYVNQPAQSNQDVTQGITGFNPYRVSQFEDTTPWLEAGMSEEFANNYLGAIEASLNSPNMVLDLRIPQNQRYQQNVLDTALAQYLADELDLEETLEQISIGWQEITEELGLDAQRDAYIGTLGVER